MSAAECGSPLTTSCISRLQSLRTRRVRRGSAIQVFSGVFVFLFISFLEIGYTAAQSSLVHSELRSLLASRAACRADLSGTTLSGECKGRRPVRVLQLAPDLVARLRLDSRAPRASCSSRICSRFRQCSFHFSFYSTRSGTFPRNPVRSLNKIFRKLSIVGEKRFGVGVFSTFSLRLLLSSPRKKDRVEMSE